jgi:[pyruvate, water dikinase]-phosphate phosphotransferase / [pyruvate, water dikinase] kinase
MTLPQLPPFPVVHLISDSTGETVARLMQACLVQFDTGEIAEYLWPFVHTPRQVDEVLAAVAKTPGFVLFTLVDEALCRQIQQGCARLGVPFYSVLVPLIDALEGYLGNRHQPRVGQQHRLDAAYFRRMDAVDFAVNHDDGQGLEGLANADVILVGVSRTSKTPCCIYLAYRGIRAANVPLVHGQPLPLALLEVASRLQPPLIVGLMQDPVQLQAIRQNRLRDLAGEWQMDYADRDHIRAEVLFSRRLFEEQGWPVIDVSRRSVEETTALVLQLLYQDHKVHDVQG